MEMGLALRSFVLRDLKPVSAFWKNYIVKSFKELENMMRYITIMTNPSVIKLATTFRIKTYGCSPVFVHNIYNDKLGEYLSVFLCLVICLSLSSSYFFSSCSPSFLSLVHCVISETTAIIKIKHLQPSSLHEVKQITIPLGRK